MPYVCSTVNRRNARETDVENLTCGTQMHLGVRSTSELGVSFDCQARRMPGIMAVANQKYRHAGDETQCGRGEVGINLTVGSVSDESQSRSSTVTFNCSITHGQTYALVTDCKFVSAGKVKLAVSSLFGAGIPCRWTSSHP